MIPKYQNIFPIKCISRKMLTFYIQINRLKVVNIREKFWNKSSIKYYYLINA